MNWHGHEIPDPDWVSPCGQAVLYCADCLDILPKLPSGCVDAVVTDPPYGMNSTTANMSGGTGTKSRWSLPTAKSAWGGLGNSWDDEAPTIVLSFPELASKNCIIWGGQFWPLPVNRCWLVWNKIIRNFNSSVCELAWTNFDAPVDAFDYSHGQLASEGKWHPTQKPEPLMSWCVKKTRGMVIDPYCGSGTTGVACARLGRRFIGIEIEKRYFDIAVTRIDQELRQGKLFTETTA